MTNKETPAPGLRERKKQATRNALAEAAVRLAAEHGAENVTVEAISEAAGVSPRTFFNYFATHDDAFVLVDEGVGERIRDAVRQAPADRPPLDVVRDAFVAELGGFEERQELWALQSKVLRHSPHLILRGLNAHAADEQALARAVMDWLDGHRSDPRAAGRPASREAATTAPAPDPLDPAGHDIDLFPRLLAAVSHTAVRVAVEHWCARPAQTVLADAFQETFARLAAGLPRPPGRPAE